MIVQWWELLWWKPVLHTLVFSHGAGKQVEDYILKKYFEMHCVLHWNMILRGVSGREQGRNWICVRLAIVTAGRVPARTEKPSWGTLGWGHTCTSPLHTDTHILTSHTHTHFNKFALVYEKHISEKILVSSCPQDLWEWNSAQHGKTFISPLWNEIPLQTSVHRLSAPYISSIIHTDNVNSERIPWMRTLFISFPERNYQA